MSSHVQIVRARIFLILIAVGFAVIAARLVDLQVVQHAELSRAVKEKTQRATIVNPRRGDILDVNKNILATSVPVKTISANPALIGSLQPVVAHALAPLLQMDEAELMAKLTPKLRRNAKGEWETNGLHYVRLAKNVPEATWQKIYATMTNLSFGVVESNLPPEQKKFLRDLRKSALMADADQMRIYPLGPLGGQVVGFSHADESVINNRAVSQIIGQDGIEFAMQKELSGAAGWRETAQDKRQKELATWRNEDVPVHDGRDVVLTIDSYVQHIAEVAAQEAMEKNSPKSVTVVVMRPKTGEILAMVSLPDYDPNNLQTVSTNNRNRVINDVVEPGSTFKIVVVSGALNEHVVTLNDIFNCGHGQFEFAGKTLHDHEPFDNLSTLGIITKSSNIGAAKIGIQLGQQKLYDYALNFGFGARTWLPLPGEASGILNPVKDWTKISIAQIPMGHGVAVTRLQMLFAMAAIANGGWLMHPMIIKQLQEHDGTVVQTYHPERVRQVITEDTSRKMVEALKTVVIKGGTAVEAAMKNYQVAGKTGTAQKTEGLGYSKTKFISSFIGFFPAEDPELCISVVMDEPLEGHYGGKVCGPVFKQIAEQCASYLNIPPDPRMMTNTVTLTATNP